LLNSSKAKLANRELNCRDLMNNKNHCPLLGGKTGHSLKELKKGCPKKDNPYSKSTTKLS